MGLKFKLDFFDAVVFNGAQDAKLAAYERELDVSHVPPLERRRLSRAAKCAFSSYEGEINRCFELQNTLARGELISPTSFSLSVHNALSSLLAINFKNSSEISAVSAYAPLEYALVQAHLMLKSGAKNALVLAYHESISQEYFDEFAPSCMVCLLVSEGKNFSLSQGEPGGKTDENLLVKFLQNFDPKQKCSWQSVDKNSAWRWDYEPSSRV